MPQPVGSIKKKHTSLIVIGVLILVIIAILVLLYFTDPAYKTWVDGLFKKKFANAFTTPADMASTSTDTDELSTGIKDVWYSTVTSDNDHYMEDYQGKLEGSVVTNKMKFQHNEWAAEVAPKSRTAMIIGDMDEATVMATPRYGLTSFRFETPKRYGNLTQLAEGDDYRHKYNTKFNVL